MSERNGNLKWNVGVIVTILLLAGSAYAAFAVLSNNMDEIKPKVTKNAEDITDLEKADIGIQASVEALGVRQETLHDQTDAKLGVILTAVEKLNDDR